jgi:hypothetical protein
VAFLGQGQVGRVRQEAEGQDIQGDVKHTEEDQGQQQRRGYLQEKKNGKKTVNGNMTVNAKKGNLGRQQSAEMLELKAQVAELKTIVSLQRTNEGWPL